MEHLQLLAAVLGIVLILIGSALAILASIKANSSSNKVEVID